MIKRCTIGDVRVTFTIARISKVVGVNSELGEGKHILMWDFDNTPLEEVKRVLSPVQYHHNLSSIYILKSSEPDNYIAYCFTALQWRKVVEILAQTPLMDWNFFKYGVYRGRFTLGVSEKNSQRPKLVARLPSLTKPNCDVDQLDSWVQYETLR